MKYIKLNESEDIEKIKHLLLGNGFNYEVIDLKSTNGREKDFDLLMHISQLELQIQDLENLHQELTKRVRGFLRIRLPSCEYELIDKFLSEMSGYATNEWKETPNFIEHIIHPNFREYYSQKCQEMKNGTVPKIMEYKIIRKDGDERWWLQLNIGAFDINGLLVSISSVIIDNTENKNAEIKYKNLFENINAGVFRTDMNSGKIIDCNKKLAEMLGFGTVEELKSTNGILDFYYDQEERSKIISSLMKDGMITDYEIKMKRKNGSIAWGSFSAKLFPQEGFLEGIAIEITQRKITEQKLKESEEVFRSFAEQSVAGMLIIKDKKIIFVNEVIVKHSGYSFEDFQKTEFKDIDKLIHPDDLPLLYEKFRLVEEKGITPEFYIRLIRNDGKIIWISTQLKKFTYEDSMAIGIIVVEVTKRVELEQRLLEERDKASKYFDIAGSMLIVFDKNANIVEINKKGSEILGYTKEEIIGKNWINCFLPERIRERVRNTFQKALNKQISSEDHFENYIITKSGEERLISWQNTILLNEAGKAEAVISSGIDITD